MAQPAAYHPAEPPPLVRLEGIDKSFGPVRANQGVTLDIRAGRIKALLGENGAGKSTLMSILSGRLAPDAGRIVVEGEAEDFRSPADAIRAGIGMVYQHFMLMEAMTVAQNVLLGQEGSFWLSPRDMERRVGELARAYGLPIDPAAKVGGLSMGEKQRVEILKLLHRKSRVLIFDEPTAVLTPVETEQLFEAMRSMAGQGKAVVFISHKLQEVEAVADEIAILRGGRVVEEFADAKRPSRAELARSMVGREVLLTVDRPGVPLGGTVLELESLGGNGLHGLDLAVRRGEIVAVAGVAGNGQKALVETVCGLAAPERGQVRILGRGWREFYARSSWKDSLIYIPEDRQGLATCANLDLVENMLLTTRQGFTHRHFLQRARAAREAGRTFREFNVQPARTDVRAGQLSGGNLQKMVLAREFFRSPKVIVAEQPSQGLDVAATEEVWKRLLEARRGAGILLVTGDLNEAVQLADRIAVMYRGRFMGVVDRGDAAGLDRIGLLMAGISEEK